MAVEQSSAPWQPCRAVKSLGTDAVLSLLWPEGGRATSGDRPARTMPMPCLGLPGRRQVPGGPLGTCASSVAGMSHTGQLSMGPVHTELC